MKRTCRAWWWFVVPVLSIVARADAAEQRPNILFIFSDDQSTRTVGCYPGSWPWVKTPHLDALAAQGVRFAHAYMGSWCMPSRASLLTGLHPHAVESMRMEGKYPGSVYDPARCRFWPSVFRAHGYQTAQIGKWHTGTDAGFGRDWDYQIVWNRPKNPDNAGDYYREQIVEWNGVEKRVSGYSTDNYTQWACDYIRGEGRDPTKPWYLWLCYGAVHGPSTPAPRHRGALAEAPVELPTDMFPPRPDKPAYLNETQAWFRGADGRAYAGKSSAQFGDEAGQKAKSYEDWVRQVNECALALDEGVGRVLAALEAGGQAKNTLIVFTADQGFGMGEHGFRSKLAPYEATYASPLIVSRPGVVAAGKVCLEPVNACDLVSTFFAQAGIEEPWKMHGRDVSAWFANPEAATSDRPLLFEHMGHYYGADTRDIADPRHRSHDVPPWVAVRRGRFKYVRTLVAGEMEELYDLRADPGELKNLALGAEHAALTAELRAAAIDELRRTDAPFVDRLPPTRGLPGDAP